MVLDDAFHYLREHGLNAKHMTVVNPPTPQDMASAGVNMETSNCHRSQMTKLFVFSAPDEDALRRVASSYRIHSLSYHGADYLGDLAYTLAERRTKFRFRNFVMANSTEELRRNLEHPRNTIRVTQEPKICFVFTGQGAQWYAMGRELLDFAAFRKSLEESEIILRDLGCQWWLIGTFHSSYIEQFLTYSRGASER